jgi:hypothetical protein
MSPILAYPDTYPTLSAARGRARRAGAQQLQYAYATAGPRGRAVRVWRVARPCAARHGHRRGHRTLQPSERPCRAVLSDQFDG